MKKLRGPAALLRIYKLCKSVPFKVAPGLAEMETGTCSFSLRMWRTVPKRQNRRSSKIVLQKIYFLGIPFPQPPEERVPTLKTYLWPTSANQKNLTGLRWFSVKPPGFLVVLWVFRAALRICLHDPCRTEGENKMTQDFFALRAFLFRGWSLNIFFSLLFFFNFKSWNHRISY